MLVSKRAIQEIARYGTIRKPNEACGLLLRGRVVELRNASELDKTWNYSLGGGQAIVQQLRALEIDLTELIAGEYLIWHTHPSGLIGPSAGDMETRIDGLEYLVVALTENGPEAARF